jgi:hypothetical protein
MSFLPVDTIVEATDSELDVAEVSHCKISDMRIWIQLHDAWQRRGRWHFANDTPPAAHNVALLGFTSIEDESSPLESSSGWLPVAVDARTARIREEKGHVILELDGVPHSIAPGKLQKVYWDFVSGDGHTITEIGTILKRLTA